MKLARRLRNPAIATALAAGLTALASLPAVDRFGGLDIDLLHALAAVLAPVPPPADSPLAVVALDEATYRDPEFAGLPKVMWTPQIAAVQDAILAGGAAVVGWDLILPTSAASYLADRNFDAPLLQSLVDGGRAGAVVLGTVQFGATTISPHPLFAWSVGGADNLRSLHAEPDEDGVVRRVPVWLEVERATGERAFVPSMALELLLRWSGAKAERTADGGLLIDDAPVRGVAGDAVTLNLLGPAQAVPTYSLADLHRCGEAGDAGFFATHFKGRIVLLGVVLDIEDRKLSSNRLITDGGPIGPVVHCVEPGATTAAPVLRATTPGVYLQAAAIANLASGTGLAALPAGRRLAATFALVLVVAGAALMLGPALSVGLIAGTAALWIGAAAHLFGQSTVLPLVGPLAAALAALMAALALRSLALDRRARFLRRAFASYVAPALVDSLADDPDQLKLGGEWRTMSFLFTDLAGFTAMLEQRPPEETARVLNAYLDGMIEIAKANGGTIDKIIGDAVVVNFSAPVHQPNHAERALACALAMDAFATDFAAEKKALGLAFGITRIGVHTGDAVVGNFGGSSFFDYTALGDTVNTAARLESVNRQLGTRIAVSGDTVNRCADFAGRRVGSLILKGKQNSVVVFEPVSRGQPPAALLAGYEEAFALMAEENPKAVRAFRRLLRDFPNDALTRFHLGRLQGGAAGEVIVLDEK